MMRSKVSSAQPGARKRRLTRFVPNILRVAAAACSLFVVSVAVPDFGPRAAHALQLRGREIGVPSQERLLGRAIGEAAREQLLGRAVDARRAPAEAEIANLNSERVDYWINRFQTDRRSDFEVFLQRKGRYEDMIRARLRARDMPEDLLYLAMIESGFDPRIRSRAGAAGIWQFIAETGRRYGLRINRSVDERLDPVKSTDAALSYLKKLHSRFGSWYLAAAAYNTGENRVGRVMREVFGRERGSDLDYFRIWDRLPGETRDYVPLMLAAERISESPHVYGFGHVRPDAPRFRAGD